MAGFFSFQAWFWVRIVGFFGIGELVQKVSKHATKLYHCPQHTIFRMFLGEELSVDSWTKMIPLSFEEGDRITAKMGKLSNSLPIRNLS